MACRYQLRRTMLNAGSAPAAELISLDKEIIKFGRNPEQVHVVLHSNLCPNMISREHAYIRQNRNPDGSISYYLFDTSLNGTYVNDVRVNTQILLHPGDVVKFGHVNGAAMMPGQPAPQPFAEFAYTFEKVPRSTSSQVQTASVAAQQVAAYDAAARRLAASPHAWPANPYAQLAAGPAAAAYLAATGFSHPYLGHIAPGLLTPPPAAAAAAAAAASALSTSTTAANQPSIGSAGAFPSGCGTYPGMVGNSPSAAIAPHHQQSTPFRASSAAVAAAAAEAAAWFNAAAVGQGAQSLPVYQHHQAANAASPFALGGHMNATPVVSSSTANAPVVSIAQHHQLQQHYQQQDLANVNRTVIGSTFTNRKPAEIDALSSLALLQKRHDQQQAQPLAYSTPAFMQQQQVRLEPYSLPTQGGPLVSNESTISNPTATIRNSNVDRIGGGYMHVQSQTDVRSANNDSAQQPRADIRKSLSTSSSDCEIIPPLAPSDREQLHAADTAVRQPPVGRTGIDDLKSNAIASNAPIRESVLVDAQSVVRTFADTSASVTAMTMTTATARVKQSSVTTSPTSSTKEPGVVAGSVPIANPSPSARLVANARGNLQKAECDSSVPSPPEDPIRRKSTGTSNAPGTGNASDEVQVLDHQQSLNHDLLRLAADARSKCLNASATNQDDVFDLEPDGAIPRRSDVAPEKSSSTSSSSSSSSSGHVDTSTKATSNASKPALGPMKSTTLTSSGASSPVATPVPKQQQEQQQSSGGSGLARKKQRSNEVKRLFDDLQASYMFSQKKKKSKNRSSDSESSSDEEDSEKEEKKRRKNSSSGNSNTSASSSRSRSRSASSDMDEGKAPSRKRAPISARGGSTSSSSSSSSSSSVSSDEADSDKEKSKPRQRSQHRGRNRNATGESGRLSSRGGKRGRRRNISGDAGFKNQESKSRGSSRGRGKPRGRPPGRRSAPAGSVSSGSSPEEKKRRRTGNGSSNRGRGRGRGSGRRGRAAATSLPFLRPEDAWNYHDPSQTCASGDNCVKPEADNVDWVECGDCERWFHVNCVGCLYDEVKDDDTEFHCGCKD